MIHRVAAVILILLTAPLHVALAAGEPPGDSAPKPSLRGRLVSGVFEQSHIFPGTRREYRVYVPAEYEDSSPANLMVFMDGLNYAKPEGDFNAPAVIDRLIETGAMPVTVAVFVNPGTIPVVVEGAADRSNRSFEYDSLGDRYARFLIDEFLPSVLDGINVSDIPARRAVCGISSGGICAFTVAWERPDQFGKVMSHIGSYTNIRGGWAYPGLIRKTRSKPKPIKVYLQEGKDDLNNLHGNWPLGNQDLARALQFAGYQYKLVMTDGGHSGKWAGREFPAALQWLWNDKAESTNIESLQSKPDWHPHPDAVVKADVPKGKLIKQEPWESKVFPGTIRDWSIYVPASYDPATESALMVFQDGSRMGNPDGRWRVTTVFDNLIAKGEMPPTIAVFIDPGHHKVRPRRGSKSSNRSYEYDSLGDRYAQFLLEEILPAVESQYKISHDPQLRAIGGSSSGAICAFTVAWERPNQFRKVFLSVGSFTNLRGGDVYPGLIRKTEPKPLRVYMADTSGDLDNAYGNWPIANKRMYAALDYMGYDVRFDWAEGYGHNADFGGSRFPEAMKWLWRTEAHQGELDTSDDLRGDLTLLNLLIPGEGWEVVADGLGFADAPCVDGDGNFYYSDMRAPGVYRIDAKTGMHTTLVDAAVSGLEFSGDGSTLYGCQGANRRVIAIDMDSGEIETLASGVTPNDLAISQDGYLYITETRAQQVTAIEMTTGKVQVVDTGITRPNGIALSNDGGTLVVSDHGGPFSWTFQRLPGGKLGAKMPTMPMRLPIDPDGDFAFNQPPPYKSAARGDGMAVDARGRYYITSAEGVQVFDPTCRPCGVLPPPDPEQPLTSCVLGGAEGDYLYVTNGSTIFRRKLSIFDPN